MGALLRDHQFIDFCKILKISGLQPNDPDKKTIEKAFRRLALKTHPDKGGDPIEFKKINDAYNKLIGHVNKLDAIESEAELSRTSVIIEISKQAVPKWKEKLKAAYGLPKTSKVNNVLFNGPYCHHKGKGKLTGPIIVVLYEDPQDKIPKLVCQCDNYMAWIQEQKMPLHLHVQTDKTIMFDQWRIMSLAEFGFVSCVPGHSAGHDYQNSNSEANYKSDAKRKKEEKERQEKEAKEEAARKAAEEKKWAEEEEAARIAEEERKKDEELSKLHQPWWQKYADKYAGPAFDMGETTPPPEDCNDDFPQVYSMTSNSYKPAPTPAPTVPNAAAYAGPNYFNSDKQSSSTADILRKTSEEPSSIGKTKVTEKPSSTEKLNSTEKTSATPIADEPIPEPSKKVLEPVQVFSMTSNSYKAAPASTFKLDDKLAATVPQADPIPAPAAVPVSASDPVAAPNPAATPIPAPTTAPTSAPTPAPTPAPAPAPKSEPSISQKKEPLEPKVQQTEPVVNGGEATMPKKTKTPEPTSQEQQEEQAKAKPSDGKKPLSNIAEKIIQKSKMKKIKTKKAVVKKAKPSTTAAASTEDTIDSEEKENVGSSRRPSESNDASIKMDDVKTSSTRKRPLEDIDVEGSKRNWENILYQMEQRNNEIIESVLDMKAAMADTCSKIHTLSL